MALIACKECGTEVSTSAKACPKCGWKVPHFKWWLWIPLGIAVAFIGFGLTIPKHEAEAMRIRSVCEQMAKQGATSFRECDRLYSDKMSEGRASNQATPSDAAVPTIPPAVGPIEINGLSLGVNRQDLAQQLQGAKLGPCKPLQSDGTMACEVQKAFRFGGVPARTATLRIRDNKLSEVHLEFDEVFGNAVFAGVAAKYNAPHDSGPTTSIWRFKDGGRIVSEPAHTNGRRLLSLVAT